MTTFSLGRAAAVLLLGVSLLASAGCEQKPAATTAVPATTAPADSTQATVAMAYVCPMGCEGSASNSPGKCPVCEMALQANPDFKPAAQ
ncbi:hypothetical protein J0X19_20430 [Hymenobacter sp. BT186]|uniref:Heavy metal binding domain-containing protein n=1 Tax=Hymenobacter telluris TaxID=2816474 RepID=A0A939JAY4_9BACT|nr:heavy metal-binding domain-containing protein [Hymenobacter telluris]MBO0360339.1 hypothetical protein [Hymenobacter telluris]MBW3376366.1 hypothetical protein [Hymenobacter norwichensis]